MYGGEKKAARECLRVCGQWKKEAKEAYQVSGMVVIRQESVTTEKQNSNNNKAK